MAVVEKAMADLASVRSATGRSYLDEEGWPSGEIEAMRRRLDEVDHELPRLAGPLDGPSRRSAR